MRNSLVSLTLFIALGLTACAKKVEKSPSDGPKSTDAASDTSGTSKDKKTADDSKVIDTDESTEKGSDDKDNKNKEEEKEKEKDKEEEKEEDKEKDESTPPVVTDPGEHEDGGTFTLQNLNGTYKSECTNIESESGDAISFRSTYIINAAQSTILLNSENHKGSGCKNLDFAVPGTPSKITSAIVTEHGFKLISNKASGGSGSSHLGAWDSTSVTILEFCSEWSAGMETCTSEDRKYLKQ